MYNYVLLIADRKIDIPEVFPSLNVSDIKLVKLSQLLIIVKGIQTRLEKKKSKTRGQKLSQFHHLQFDVVTSWKHLRAIVTPSLHLTYSTNWGNLG